MGECRGPDEVGRGQADGEHANDARRFRPHMSDGRARARNTARHWQALHFADPQELLALGQEAEALGFAGIALGDHLLLPERWQSPYPYTADGKVAMSPHVDFPDPWVSFAALATQTRHLMFTTWVYILPLRDIFTVAKSVATPRPLCPRSHAPWHRCRVAGRGVPRRRARLHQTRPAHG